MNQAFVETQPFNYGATIVAADGTALKTLLPAGVAFRNVDQIICTNSDVISHDVGIVLNVGGVDFNVASISVPPGAGFAGAAAIDIIQQWAVSGVTLQALLPSTLLKVNAEVAVTLTNSLQFVLLGASL